MGVPEVRATYLSEAGERVVCPFAAADAGVVVEGRPVREFPVYRGRRSYSGLFWSATMERHVVYESLLELEWLWLADFDQRVDRFAAQPVCLQGSDGSRQRTRYPDFLCLPHDGVPRLVDVKPARRTAEPEVAASLEWTAGVCRDRGWGYEVWTGGDPVALRNIRLLAAGRRPGIPRALVVDAVTALDGGVSLGELEARVGARYPVPRLLIFAALWHGVLECDLAAPLGIDTVVEVVA